MRFYKETEFKKEDLNGRVVEIPKDWEVVKLEKVCKKIKAGGTPSTKKSEYWNGNIPFAKIEDITSAGKYLKKTSNHISEEGLKRSNAWIVPENSLLLAMYGSLGEVAINKIPVATNQAILGIITNESICDIEFLYYWFLYFKPNWVKYAKPTTQANLTAEIVKNTVIPLPPLEEQKKIAEILMKIDKAIETIDEAINRAERIKKELMHELLSGRIRVKAENGRIGFYKETQFEDTEIGKIPKDWDVVRLGDVAKLESGGTPSRQKPEYWENGTIPWVKSGELNDGIIYDTQEKITELGLKNSSAKIFPKGTLLIALYGATVGKTGILGIDASTNQAVCAILPITPNTFDSKFLQYCLILLRDKLIAQSSGGAQPNIYLYTLKSFKIPLPPLEEQKQIARILSKWDELIELKKAKKNKLERMKKAVMELLLTGKVRVLLNQTKR